MTTSPRGAIGRRTSARLSASAWVSVSASASTRVWASVWLIGATCFSAATICAHETIRARQTSQTSQARETGQVRETREVREARETHDTGVGATLLTIGDAETPLHGPWRFRVGDDVRWADQGYDDRAWETVDLTPAADAHDPDVGLTGYVAGWMARGHPEHDGYAWYRLRVAWQVEPGTELVLVGPALVDDAYEIYWNGRVIGASGDFSGANYRIAGDAGGGKAREPRTYATKPALYHLPATPAPAHAPTSGPASTPASTPTPTPTPALSVVPPSPSPSTPAPVSGEAIVAVRVFMSRGIGRDADAGGMHIAPILATREAGRTRLIAQWSQTILGYIVDVVEPALLLAVATFAWFLASFEPPGRVQRGLAAALLLTAALRVNQAVFFWWSIEDLPTFVTLKGAMLEPLGLCAWTLAWSRWTDWPAAPASGPRTRGINFAAGGASSLDMPAALLAVVCAIAALAGDDAAIYRSMMRAGFAVLLILLGARILRRGPDPWLALCAMCLIATGQFAEELWSLGVPGIWFPFGVGVSRTQFAYALLVPALTLLLARRARRRLRSLLTATASTASTTTATSTASATSVASTSITSATS